MTAYMEVYLRYMPENDGGFQLVTFIYYLLGPLSLTWINFNANMDT